jgi:hypothetical protein
MVVQQEPNPGPFEKLKRMDAFGSLEDPRRLKNWDYPLEELLLTAVLRPQCLGGRLGRGGRVG